MRLIAIAIAMTTALIKAVLNTKWSMYLLLIFDTIIYYDKKQENTL